MCMNSPRECTTLLKINFILRISRDEDTILGLRDVNLYKLSSFEGEGFRLVNCEN